MNHPSTKIIRDKIQLLKKRIERTFKYRIETPMLAQKNWPARKIETWTLGVGVDMRGRINRLIYRRVADRIRTVRSGVKRGKI